MEKIDNHLFYKNSYKKHGIGAKGVHWYDTSTQFIRFEILINPIKNQMFTSTLLDVGCGFGHLLDFFKDNKIYPKIYLGIDKEQFFIELCKMQYHNFDFFQCDILKDKIPNYEFLVCSGALNLLDKIDFLKGIKNCYDVAIKGFIFNFLVEDSIHKLTKKEIIDYCNTLCNDLIVYDNYLKNDCTIYMKK
jgi:SAM-dependent methyltransferase